MQTHIEPPAVEEVPQSVDEVGLMWFASGSLRMPAVASPEPSRAVVATVVVAVIGAIGVAFIAAPVAVVLIALAVATVAGARLLRAAPAH